MWWARVTTAVFLHVTSAGGTGGTSPKPFRVTPRDAAVLALVVQDLAQGGSAACIAFQSPEALQAELPTEVVRLARLHGVTLLPLSQCSYPEATVALPKWKGLSATVAFSRHPCMGAYTVRRRFGILGKRRARS